MSKNQFRNLFKKPGLNVPHTASVPRPNSDFNDFFVVWPLVKNKRETESERERER